MHKSKHSIKILKDGPYEVSGETPLNVMSIATDANGDSVCWEKGKNYGTGENVYCLCRCGRSNDKPFCDGAHTTAGFRGAEVADQQPYSDRAGMYEGRELDLMDDESLCVEARFCDRGATIWNLVTEGSGPKDRSQAIDEACNCPSGRLTIADKDGRLLEPDLPEEISLINDPSQTCRGPLWVKGGITVRGAQGEEYEARNRVTLCRCGESTNMPYCDGSHYECPHMAGQDK